MGIRKITFDNGDIVLAKNQAILYDLLLKQQTKTLLPNNEIIYQNSTGFLIQNESEKLTYSYKNIDDGVEFTFNPQLYLSICGRIIKLEKNTKYLFDWNDIENNETYYVVVRVDLNKEAKIINSELKEFGNPVEVKLINTKEKLTQDNLNQKSNNGIYEFPLISFKAKFKKDINALENIENIKDETKYLLPFLMESNRTPSKLLTITQKIQEEIETIENNLTDLKYRKIKELRDLEKYILGKDIKNWKLVVGGFISEKNNDNKNYFGIIKIENGWKTITWIGKRIDWKYQYKAIYRWDGIGEPNTPIIDLKNGKIIDWNGINI